MGCATHYVISDGTRYIGCDSDTKENIIVESFKKAVKLRLNQINAIYNRLADDLLKDGEMWMKLWNLWKWILICL